MTGSRSAAGCATVADITGMATLTDTIERSGVAATRRTLHAAIAGALGVEVPRAGIRSCITTGRTALQIVGSTTRNFLPALLSPAAECLARINAL